MVDRTKDCPKCHMKGYIEYIDTDYYFELCECSEKEMLGWLRVFNEIDNPLPESD